MRASLCSLTSRAGVPTPQQFSGLTTIPAKTASAASPGWLRPSVRCEQVPERRFELSSLESRGGGIEAPRTSRPAPVFRAPVRRRRHPRAEPRRWLLAGPLPPALARCRRAACFATRESLRRPHRGPRLISQFESPGSAGGVGGQKCAFADLNLAFAE
jgi:hypothetical protein